MTKIKWAAMGVAVSAVTVMFYQINNQTTTFDSFASNNEELTNQHSVKDFVESQLPSSYTTSKNRETEQLEKVNAYFSQLKFGETIKQQFDSFKDLTTEEQKKFLDEWSLLVDDKLANGEISNAEALFLKMSLIKSSFQDEQAKMKAQDLVDDYKKKSEAQWQHYLNNRDPQFLSYKEAEKKLVSEILSMSQYPDGLTRDQYLKRRLKELKEQHYPSS